jgi:serine O-acetyltransferase
VVGIPAKSILPRDTSQEFLAYGTPTGEMPDPVARALDGLLDQVSTLRARVEELERTAEAPGSATDGAADDDSDDARPLSAAPDECRRLDC